MLYHGSTSLFKNFETNVKKRVTLNETNSLGIWLTNDIDSAKNFSIGVETICETSKTDFWDDGQQKKYMVEKIVKGYLYTVDTKDVKLKEFYSNNGLNDSFDLFMDYRDQYCHYIGFKKGQCSWKRRFLLLNKEEANKDFISDLKSKGYGGFVIRNTEYDAVIGTIDQYCLFNKEDVILSDSANIDDIVSSEELEMLTKKALENHYSIF